MGPRALQATPLHAAFLDPNRFQIKRSKDEEDYREAFCMNSVEPDQATDNYTNPRKRPAFACVAGRMQGWSLRLRKPARMQRLEPSLRLTGVSCAVQEPLKEFDRSLSTGFHRKNFVGLMPEPSDLTFRIVSGLLLNGLPAAMRVDGSSDQ